MLSENVFLSQSRVDGDVGQEVQTQFVFYDFILFSTNICNFLGVYLHTHVYIYNFFGLKNVMLPKLSLVLCET